MRRSWKIPLSQSINRLLFQVLEWTTASRCSETSFHASPNASPRFKYLNSLLKSMSQYEPTSGPLVRIDATYYYGFVVCRTLGNEFEYIKLTHQKGSSKLAPSSYILRN